MSTTYTQSIKVGMCAIVCVAAFAMSSFAHAETSTSTATTTPVVTTPTPATSPTIAALMSQLAKLTELFNQLKTQMLGMKAEIKVLRDGIKEGSTGDDVKEIQEILASDSSIYPAGLTTGYFGPLTAGAIRNFQEKNGLEVTGVIDAETKAAFDTIIAQRKIEGKIPFGLLLAPGLKMKFEDQLKMHCVNVTASSTQASTCKRVTEKYKFEVDDKGRIKMESKVKVEDDNSIDSNEDDSDDDTDDTEDTDDSDDDTDDDNN